MLASMRTWMRPGFRGAASDLTIASGQAAGEWRAGLRLVESTREKVGDLVTLKKLGCAVFGDYVACHPIRVTAIRFREFAAIRVWL